MNKLAKKLLLVEDDEALAKTLIRRLAKHDFTVVHANNVNDALLECHRHSPDFIILDMKLESESGLTLIKPIRNVRPKARIILLTGFASIATAVDAIKLGADDYLAKPVDTKTLLVALMGGEKIETIIETVAEPVLSAEQIEWQHIQQVLKINNGNISATARQLSMHRRTLQRKLQKKPSVLKANYYHNINK